MRNTVELCIQHGVAIGAHPSFADRENFGRTEMQLATTDNYVDMLNAQLEVIAEIVLKAGGRLHHVKPHGALYNMSARDKALAAIIARVVKEFDPTLVLFGLSGSASIAEAEKCGLRTASEVFADRTYQPNGSLTPRSQPNALVQEEQQAVQQALNMALQGTVQAVDGTVVPVRADTLCLHGDGAHAVAFARLINQQFTARGIRIQPV